ncbi:hypothetical protein [Hydrocoleum sp. CS-953]|uniref:hypothetical protein n=1 Tax=Microcoleaceae TaxID=1892252 RepID=UPI000B9A2552|nr:hypothetical protein [Hydrocoleum sp. CS-953]OZH53101.1 hypothetical protein AFK68_19895 [Hydrocoleum sp. CS-953]
MNDFDRELNSKIARMLDSQYFLAFIDQTLKQFKLDCYYDVMDIVVEAQKIALEKIISREIVEINKVRLRRICFKVIRNLANKTKCQKSTENKTKELDRKIDRMLESKSFLAFIDQKLKQFRLHSYYDLMDVVVKAREIGLGKIISGKIDV